MLKDWDQLEQHFAEMIAENLWQQQPMIEFIRWVRQSEWADRLALRTSHAAVGLCSSDRSAHDATHVYIDYRERDQRFELVWYRGGDTVPTKELVHSPNCPEVWNRVLRWLGLDGAENPHESRCSLYEDSRRN